ncbi:alpha/beta fold hydrolase [Polymorphobacter arshaanensis]|uniref:Alpha/beta fold hydrolase n=1 Tax=Glacieibacterium arshaanense TaxID=2511025 RepID=A0A4Y9EQU6_9SPHN|nr:alpha/beta fold hydrolase [Polymorphobacter arshaanensis]TFU05639.1 alpha/beta fold hydrolase [Polymorphobacter arshaanensis]
MNWGRLAVPLVAITLATGGAAGATQIPGPKMTAADPREQHTVVMPDFTFADGRSQPLRIAYHAFGTPHRGSDGSIDNAVLLLHGTGGSSAAFLDPKFDKRLYAAGAPLDLAKTYVVLVDAIGTGGSSKPSDGAGRNFPHYDYHDMVVAQAHVVRKTLGIRKLKLVLGISMGGSNAWLWATEFPDLAGTVIVLSSLPVKPTGRNLLWRIASRDALLADPSPGGAGVRTAHAISALVMVAPPALKMFVPGAKAAEAVMAGEQPASDGLDLAWQLDAVRTYDPQPLLDAVTARVVNLNFADDPLYPPDTDPMPAIVKQFPNIRTVIVPASDATMGHMTLGEPRVWLPYVEADIRAALAR